MWKSRGGDARITPVRPPNTNETRKPSENTIGVSKVIDPRHIVPIQLKIFTPVGTAMSIVISAKKGSSTPPVTYMWWAHTDTESAAMEMVAYTRVLYPKIGLRLNTGKISETIPKNGNAMM